MWAERFTAQLLAGPPASDAVAVAERLLAVQAQDPRGARLAVRARTTGRSAADFDGALSDRSLLVTWLNRGTLHLVRSEDYPWLHASTTPQLERANARRLAQEGVTPRAAERGIAVIESSLASEGPLSPAQLGDRIAAAGVRTAGQALVHQLALVSLRGLTVRGPVIDGEHRYVLVRDWLGETPAVDRERALAELARRYLMGHGPAADRDLARWAGITLRDARAGLSAIASLLVSRGDGMIDLLARPAPLGPPPPRLLGSFEPLLLGWRSRQDIVGTHAGIVTANGIFRPRSIALVSRSSRSARPWACRRPHYYERATGRRCRGASRTSGCSMSSARHLGHEITARAGRSRVRRLVQQRASPRSPRRPATPRSRGPLRCANDGHDTHPMKIGSLQN